jgi:cytochrome c biogenesis factor
VACVGSSFLLSSPFAFAPGSCTGLFLFLFLFLLLLLLLVLCRVEA